MNNTHNIVLNGKSHFLPTSPQFRLNPIVLACAAALAFGAAISSAQAASCIVNGTTYADCTVGQAGTAGVDASGTSGATGSNGNTAGNPGNSGANGSHGLDATNTATSGGTGDVAVTGGTIDVTTGNLLAGGAGGSGGNANGGNGGNGGWPIQWTNANGGNGGDAGLAGVAENGGMGGNAMTGSGFNLSNDGSIIGGSGGAGGNAFGGAGGRGGQGANNSGRSGDGGDGSSGGTAGNGAAGATAVTGSNFQLVNRGIINGGNGGRAGLATGGSAGGTDYAGAPLGTIGSVGQAGAEGTSGTYGAAGVGVVSTGSSTITTSNLIAGGLAGNGTTQANAIEFSGGNNTLTLESGYSFVGNVISSGGDTLALGGDTNGSFFVSSLAATSPSSWSGAVQYYGFNDYVKTGNSTWTLNGSTTEVTAWNINAGTLSVSNDSNLGAAGGGLTFNGGTLENTAAISTARDMLLKTTGTLQTNANLTATGLISGLGSLVKTGAATFTLTNNNTYSGGTTINAGALQIGNGGTTGSVVGNIINNSALLFNRSDALTYGGVVSGSGSVVQTGNGPLTLTGDNTFTGDTIISAGTLQIGNGGTTGSVAGDIINNSALVFNRSDALTYGGVISGSGSVVQTGNGMLILAGNNTYTGGTVLNSGTLVLQGVNAAGTGGITNNNEMIFLDTKGEFSHEISGTGNITLHGGSEVRANATTSVSAVNIDNSSKLTLLDSTVWRAGNGFSNAGTLELNHLSRLSGNVNNSGVLILSNQQYVTSYIDGHFNNRGSIVLNPTATSAGNNLIINGDYVGVQGSSVSLGAVLADDDSLTDQLTILGNSSGTSTLYLANEKGHGAQTLLGLKLITVQGDSDAVFTQGNRITAGLYDYSLVKKENDWYLDSHSRQVRPEAASYATNLQAANTLFTLSLHDRAGETQYEDLVTGETRSTSMWMRNEGGRNKASMTDGQNKTSTNRYVLQLGGDVLQVSSESLGKFNLGVMGGYANAQGQTYNSQKGYSSRNTITGYSTGMYGSWYANNREKGGLYADSWLQYNWFRNQVNGQDMAEEKYDSQGMTASLETGYDWLVNSWTTAHGIRNTLWLQPHAQAIWMGVKADDHTENTGSYVQGLGNNNVQTKLGLRTYLNGKSALDKDTERKFQPYVEANWVYNTNQYGVRMDGVDDHIKGARNVGELKTGVEAKLTANLSMQGGISGQIGDNSYSDIAASLGGKFNF
ncbi:autotransporter outer membrane beta-barrel domain-containing protein [Yersinia rochesterensis]|uniref:autotransporter outer membrane beta-barrel domain-containing protein n=1 Tax=Yersinia rochesterensis TaxID=1604335 RepID=UPI0011A37276|nr:autotransporter outer membrane beta-barrel domain-containing protein [Yersinia rochesterensis]